MPSSGLISRLQPYFDKLTGTGTSLQVLSDLHLEYCSQYTTFHVPTKAPYLVLAGNVGRLRDYRLYLDFMANACTRFKRVFLVLGTQELYGLTREQAKAQADRLQQEPAVAGKLSVLDRTRIDVGSKLTLLGCTLFSNLSLEEPESTVSQNEDFKRIPEWTAQKHVQGYQTDVQWLKQETELLRKQRGLDHKILVVTNFAPFANDPASSSKGMPLVASENGTEILGLGSDLDTVQAWVFGRTGRSIGLMRGKVLLVSNQRGTVTPFEDDDTTPIRGIEPLVTSNGSRTKKASGFDVRRTIRL